MAEPITAVQACDGRFPASLDLDGSDAMNPGPELAGVLAQWIAFLNGLIALIASRITGGTIQD